MDLDAVDRVLDMRIIFSLTGSLPVAEFTKRLSLELQSGLHFGEDSLELSFFIPDELAANREIAIFLAQSNATKEGNVYFSNFGMATEDLHKGLKAAIEETKTMVADNLWLSSGTYYLSCRFHSSELQRVTGVVLGLAQKIEGFSVKYLGPNPGLPAILKDVKKIVNLMEIRWQVNVPEESRKSNPFSSLTNNWVLESRFMTTGMSASELVITNEKVSDPEDKGLVLIDPELNLYEFKLGLDNPFLKGFFRNLYLTKMVRFCRTLRYDNGKLELLSYIPEVLIDSYISSLSGLSDEFPEWELSLSKVADAQWL